MTHRPPFTLLAAAALALATTSLAHADTGKLLLTGGVSTIAGSAGGGLTPWAVIGSNATEGEVGFSGYVTRAATQDYSLNGYGVAVGLYDRVELSLARQDFDASPAIALNGIAPFGVTPGQHIKMDVIGIKVKVAGDAVHEQDTWLPQISVGLQYKKNNQGPVLAFIGAKDDSGTDFYVSATKLLLAQGVLLNGTVRFTKANQIGILGFGGDRNDSYRPQFEASVAYLLSRKLAIGAEYRTKPNNLGIAREDDWFDVFVAYQPAKNVSLTLAYVDLGNIVIKDNQRGLYASLQVGF